MLFRSLKNSFPVSKTTLYNTHSAIFLTEGTVVELMLLVHFQIYMLVVKTSTHIVNNNI